MMHDLINDALVGIKNSERIGQGECTIKPSSKLLVDVLKVFQREGYIGEFETEDKGGGGILKIKLVKQINNCGVIKPRFPVKYSELTDWEKRYLPSRDFGLLVVSTPQGVMSHKEAREKKTGGRLLAYVY